jgi:leader peptidase (prepilin peptidase)/N-methyltransferase
MSRSALNVRFAAEGLDLCIRSLITLRPAELLAIIASPSLAIAACALLFPDRSWLVGGLFGLLTMTIAVVDARFFRIPDLLTAALFTLGLVGGALAAPERIGEVLGMAVVRAGSYALLFLLFRSTYRMARKREGLGLGDVKLAAAAGAWLDWFALLGAVEIAATSALLLYLIRGFSTGQPVRMKMRLPFGLFFAPAIFIAWLLALLQWPLLGGS